jgi:transposase
VFAEATASQALPDWLLSHRHMFEYFGGVTQIIVPDNLKSGITKPDRYEATINESYRELAEHYGSCVIPARVRKPKDKAKVEVSVQVITRWIIMALRKRMFYSLAELNAAIRELLVRVNGRKMRHIGKSRRELFEQFDKPALKPLPAKPYEFGLWKRVRVNVDYHVVYDNSFYSVPHQLIGKELWLRASANNIELYQDLQRVCAHRRTHIKGRYQTEPSHRPKAHQEHLKWTPERITDWAGAKGAHVKLFIAKLIASKAHPEQSYRSAMGCIRLADKYGVDSLNKACEKALALGSYRYQTVNNMLKNGMEKVSESSNQKNKFKEQFTGPENTRGSEYYH